MLNTNDRIVKHKVGLLNLADELGNISKACKMMGVSRDTFYRYKEAVDDGGVESLFDKNRRVPNPKMYKSTLNLTDRFRQPQLHYRACLITQH